MLSLILVHAWHAAEEEQNLKRFKIVKHTRQPVDVSPSDAQR